MKTIYVYFLFVIGVLFNPSTFAQDLPKLINVACRAPVSDIPFIGGFTIKSERKMLIRAVGPGLRDFGVSNFCRDPILTLFKDQDVIASNNDWNNSAEVRTESMQMGAFPLASGSKDAAILITLQEGSYTAVMTCATGMEGIALLEVYDLNWKTPGGLSNLSMRGMSGPGERMLIPGIVIGEQALGTFLFRAVGPGLAQFGIQDFLPNPKLSLRTKNNIIYQESDSWQPRFSNFYFQSKGAFPLPSGSRDAALLSGTSPFAPTPDIILAAVEDKDLMTGIVLLEFYLYAN